MKTRIAACHCGQFELTCENEPKLVSLCHCTDCQRRTGSVFGVTAVYSRRNVRVTKGVTTSYTRSGASGGTVTLHFCGTCGANVYWELARAPTLICVGVGSFADPTFPAPDQSIWTKDKHAWLDLPDHITTYDTARPVAG